MRHFLLKVWVAGLLCGVLNGISGRILPFQDTALSAREEICHHDLCHGKNSTRTPIEKGLQHSELNPRARDPFGSHGPESPNHIGEGTPSNPGSQAPTSPQHIGDDTPSNPGGQASTSPQHIGDDTPSNPGGQAPTSPQHIGEDAPRNPGSQAPASPQQDTPSNPGSQAPTSPKQDTPNNEGDHTSPQHIEGDNPGSSSNQAPDVEDNDLSSKYVSSEDLATKGRKVERVQPDAVEQHKKDKTYDPNNPDSYLPMDRRYSVSDDDPDFTPDVATNGRVDPIMQHPDIALDPFQPWTYRQINSRGESSTNPTSIALYSKDQKAIFAQWRYTELDKDPSPESMMLTPGWTKGDPIPPRLPACEILWQQYKSVAGDTAGELRFIVIHPVANENTNRVITEAHLAKKVEKGEKDTGKRTFTSADSNWDNLRGDTWHALLGTDNVKGIPFMTADHHNELGDKVITKIHTWSPDRDNSVSMGALVIELG